MRNIVFFLVITSIVVAVDIYVWQGIKTLTQNWSLKDRNILRYIYFGITLIGALFFFYLRFIQPETGRNINNFEKMVMSLIFILFIAKVFWMVFLIVDDILRIVRFGFYKISDQPNSIGENGISRMKFLNWAGFGIGSFFFGAALYGIIRGAHNYFIAKRTVFIPDLPTEFEGTTIVQISDVHSGSFWNKKAVQKGIDMINSLNADLVFFTGDLVNDRAMEFDPWKSTFGQIKSKLGIFSTLGNHDYGDYIPWPTPQEKLANLEKLKQHHQDMGWKLLMDENVIFEKNNKKLAIIGVQNYSMKGRFPKYGNLSKAYEGAENAEVQLLLSHDPSHWRGQVIQEFNKINITFSGHTHGMQFGIDTKFYRWSPVKFIYQEWADLYQEKNQYLYVNRGFGYLGFPGRVGINPEITHITLTSKKS